MKIRALRSIVVAVGLGSLLFAACANKPGAGTTTIATETDDGRAVVIPESGILEVELESNPTTGFTWALVGVDESVLEPLSDRRLETFPVPPDAGLIGASSLQQFRFKGLGIGETRLELVYARPPESPSSRDERTFELLVGVEQGHVEPINIEEFIEEGGLEKLENEHAPANHETTDGHD